MSEPSKVHSLKVCRRRDVMLEALTRSHSFIFGVPIRCESLPRSCCRGSLRPFKSLVVCLPTDSRLPPSLQKPSPPAPQRYSLHSRLMTFKPSANSKPLFNSVFCLFLHFSAFYFHPSASLLAPRFHLFPKTPQTNVERERERKKSSLTFHFDI